MVNVRKNQPKDKSGNIVAVYYASGEIVDYESSSFSDQPTISPPRSSATCAACRRMTT